MELSLAVGYVPPMIFYHPIPDGTVIPLSWVIATAFGLSLLIAWVIYNMVRR